MHLGITEIGRKVTKRQYGTYRNGHHRRRSSWPRATAYWMMRERDDRADVSSNKKVE
jgi:hypothetical protein